VSKVEHPFHVICLVATRPQHTRQNFFKCSHTLLDVVLLQKPQVCAQSFDVCAAAWSRTGRWHEIGVQLLTRYTLFQSFKRHDIAIITHAKSHGNYDSKQAK